MEALREKPVGQCIVCGKITHLKDQNYKECYVLIDDTRCKGIFMVLGEKESIRCTACKGTGFFDDRLDTRSCSQCRGEGWIIKKDTSPRE
jgi:DnaJ-class molecular chaperone